MQPLIRRPKGRGASKPSRIREPNFERAWEKVVCIASGPSLTFEQCAVAKASGWRTIVINNSWQMLPDADVLYAGDKSWWDMHLPAVQKLFKGECWTQSRLVAHKHALHWVRCSNEPGLTTKPGTVFGGSNSGYQAVNLAYLFGAKRIALLGYDMQRTNGMSHWHGDHPKPLSQDMPIAAWLKHFEGLARDLREKGIEVVNCTTETALLCFPRQDLAQCLS